MLIIPVDMRNDMNIKIKKQTLHLESSVQLECIDVTDRVREALEQSGIREGSVTVFSPHTTMALVINHNEPMLMQDFMNVLYRLVPVDDNYAHDMFELRKGIRSDGRSNGHAHCKAMLLPVSQTVPIERGRMVLSSQQSILAVELDGSRKREIIVQIMGI